MSVCFTVNNVLDSMELRLKEILIACQEENYAKAINEIEESLKTIKAFKKIYKAKKD